MDFTQHASFSIFLICAAILVAKMLIIGHATGAVRFKRGSFASPEDAEAFRQEAAEGGEHPDVTRFVSAHRNDLESTVPFLAIGVLYLATDPSPGFASGLFIWFTALRVFFSFAYLKGLQPWRSVSFLLAEISLVIMIVQMARWGFAHLG